MDFIWFALEVDVPRWPVRWPNADLQNVLQGDLQMASKSTCKMASKVTCMVTHEVAHRMTLKYLYDTCKKN